MSTTPLASGGIEAALAVLFDKYSTAERLRISVRSLENLMARRCIAFRRIGGSVRFTSEDIAAFIEKARIAPLDELMTPRRRRPTVTN